MSERGAGLSGLRSLQRHGIRPAVRAVPPDHGGNPRGEKDSAVTGKRIRRGGSIKSAPEFCRNANRASSVPELRGVDLGLRLVRTQVAAAEETSPAAIDLTTDTEAEIIEGEIEDLSTGRFDAVEK